MRRRYNFGLFCVRWGSYTVAPWYQRDAWDDDRTEYDLRGGQPWVFSIVPPLHWPVRFVARFFGGWYSPFFC